MEVGREGGSRKAWTNTHVCLVLRMFKANTRTTENYGERIFQHVTTKLILRESTLLYAMGGNKRIKIFSEKDWEMCLMELQNVSHKDLLILHKLLVLYNWINFRSTVLIGERERERELHLRNHTKLIKFISHYIRHFFLLFIDKLICMISIVWILLVEIKLNANQWQTTKASS